MTRDKYYEALDRSVSLKHFGRPGQTKGARHSRYPLAPSEFTEKEREAGGQVFASNELRINKKDQQKFVNKAASLYKRGTITVREPTGKVRTEYNQAKTESYVKSNKISRLAVDKIVSEIKEKRDEIEKQSDSLVGDYIKNSEVRDKYAGIAGLAAAYKYRGSDPTLSDIAQIGYSYVREDDNAGVYCSSSLYIYDNFSPERASEVYDLGVEYSETVKNIVKISKDFIEKSLSDANDIVINEQNGRGIKDYIGGKVSGIAYTKLSRGSINSPYYYEAVVTGPEMYKRLMSDDSLHDNVAFAKKVMSKLPSLSEKSRAYESGWDYFNSAVEDLGMDDIKANDLTDADWNKINSKIRELRQA